MSAFPVQRKPGVSAGRYCLPRTGVGVWAILSRWFGGDSLAHLDTDYGVPPGTCEAAIRWWATRPKRLRVRIRRGDA